jgi:hypothetical protein
MTPNQILKSEGLRSANTNRAGVVLLALISQQIATQQMFRTVSVIAVASSSIFLSPNDHTKHNLAMQMKQKQ